MNDVAARRLDRAARAYAATDAAYENANAEFERAALAFDAEHPQWTETPAVLRLRREDFEFGLAVGPRSPEWETKDVGELRAVLRRLAPPSSSASPGRKARRVAEILAALEERQRGLAAAWETHGVAALDRAGDLAYERRRAARLLLLRVITGCKSSSFAQAVAKAEALSALLEREASDPAKVRGATYAEDGERIVAAACALVRDLAALGGAKAASDEQEVPRLVA